MTLEEELGEGAFGKVYKGVLVELPTPSRKLSIMSSTRRKISLQKNNGFTVAIKMLHGKNLNTNYERKEVTIILMCI